MRQSALLRYFLISLVFALGVGQLSLMALRSLNESSTGDMRRHMILSLAQTMESAPFAEAITNLRSHSGRHGPPSNLWVFSPDGKVLATNQEGPPPIAWADFKKPAAVHDFTFHYLSFHFIPDLTLVKLDTKDGAFLLIGSNEPRHPGAFGRAIWAQAAFFLFLLAVIVLGALFMIYIYMRRKSKEAHAVLSRLEKGDLKARFEIRRVDEIGSLMLGFNRMASEIERLVNRVTETEKARKHLLEELSHDLRTPLTSLKTSIETLSDHMDEMPKAEQKEFISVIRGELGYFLHLIEDLFFIADLAEPRYKNTTEKIDLKALLTDEVGRRQTQKKGPVQWEISVADDDGSGELAILGDSILIQRLFKNALDNAAKHAASRVHIQLRAPKGSQESIETIIEDDGPGITPEAVRSFAQRKKVRILAADAGHNVSLGLGSVIMKTILEFHGGNFQIEKNSPELARRGTQLTLRLPKFIPIIS